MARVPRACGVRARAHARGVPPPLPWRCVSRGAWGAPARPAPPCAARAAAVSRPPPVPGFAAGGWRAGAGRGRAWLWEALPWGVAPGWTERMEVGDGLPRRGSRGSGPQRRALWGGPGSWGGSLRVLRPAGAAGVAGPPSCWWRWDPVHVYPVARLASPLARPSPSPCPPPRTRCLVLASCVPPPRSLRPTSRSVLLLVPTLPRLGRPSARPPLLLSLPPSPCRDRDQASPFVGCPPPPWAAVALGGPGPGRSAVGPTRV